MKKLEYDKATGKVIFDSPYKAFNKRVDYISTGNVISDVQCSSYVRPWNDTVMPNGDPCEEGRLRKFDITPFYDMTPLIRDFIMRPDNRNKKMILYRFRFYHGKARGWVGLGWVITDEDHRELYHITDTEYYGRNCYKTAEALEECMRYVCA